MPRPLVRRLARACAPTLVLALASCTFDVDLWNHIDSTRVLGARAYVTELSPAWPSRVGFLPNDPQPITEPFPGDRVRLELIVVDEFGEPQPAEDFDALWFQCGVTGCVDGYARLDARVGLADEQACAAQDWTTDSICRLGRGGALEFVLPPLGQEMMDVRVGRYYAAVALDDEQDAEDCLRARIERDEALAGCSFVDRPLKIGPSWPLLVEGTLAGLSSTIPVFEIPAPALFQPANREPPMGPITFQIGGSSQTLTPEGPPTPVVPGATIDVEFVTLLDGALQQYFSAREVEPGVFVFVDGQEFYHFDWFTTGGLVRLPLAPNSSATSFRVHENAEAGPSRLLLLYGDDRSSLALTWFDFEVVR